MDYLKVFLLAYLLAVQPTTSGDFLSEVRQIHNAGKEEHHKKGCTILPGSTECKRPVTTDETRASDADPSVLPYNSECLTYDGCFTCTDRGLWVTSDCHKELQHREKRSVVLIVGAVIAIIGALVGVFDTVCKYFCKGEKREDYKPPEFTGCKNLVKHLTYTPKGKREAIVTWKTPTYKAGSAGEPTLTLMSNVGESGSLFTVGFYTISYHLVDNRGFTVSCSFSFKVDVRTCSRPDWVENRHIKCGGGEIIYGNDCEISCARGYDLKGEPNIVCEQKGEFDNALPTCEKIKCRKLTKPDNCDSFSCTDSNNYNSECTLTCDTAAGFTSSPPMTVCKSSGDWLMPSGQLRPKCLDTANPTFTTCPSESVQAYADKGRTTAVVKWTKPEASDNSGRVKVKQVKGLKSGNTFKEGVSLIGYTATDFSENKAHCTFGVNVVVLYCEIPSFNDTNMIFDCTQGFQYGSECAVSCKVGLPLNGSNTITCEKDNSVPPVTYWDYGDEDPPQCIKRPCDDLTPPKNGALACDNNMGGMYCVMSCNKNWDIPRSAVAVNMYTCGWSKGKWMPSDVVPDCTAKHVAHRLRLRAELYYSGNCSSPSTQKEIKEKFVQVVNSSVIWNDGCPCRVENVTVICGETTHNRRRRGVQILEEKIEKRSTEQAAIISWYWVVPIEDGDRANVINIADELLMVRADQMYSLVQNNKLDIGVDGFEMKQGSFGYDESDIVCPPGHLGIYRTGTCSPCPTGTMYSEASDDCVMCPLGTYQDEEGQFQCKACPDGTKSIIEGARMYNECIELCPAGHSSSSSVVPCDSCPIGTYQLQSGSTSCISCEHGSTTTSAASTNASSCQPFDVLMEGPATVLSKGVLDKDTDDLTICIWLATRSAEGSIAMKQPDGTSKMRVHFGQTSTLSLLGNDVFSLDMSTFSWVHICLVFNPGNQTVIVYKNGVADTPRIIHSSRTLAFSSGSRLEVDLETRSVITVRSVFVIPSALSAKDVRHLASSCGSRPGDFVISLSDLTSAEDSQQTVRVTTPSTCDAVDECQVDAPCNGHTCINLPGSYRCECQDGFSGPDCSRRPDYCADNSCQDGLCVNGTSNYTCLCHEGFKGRLCDELIVNGAWSDWSPWNQCSLTCGGGTQTRSRRCDDPEPTQPEGKNCTGSASETRSCNTRECLVCVSSDVRRGIGSTPRCNGTVSALDCIPVCRNPNHVVDITDRLIVSCRNGIWDSKRPKVASCTEVTSPSELRIDTKGTLNTGIRLSHVALNDVESSINHNAGSLPCSADASCQTTVRAQDAGWSASDRKRRSTGTIVIITMSLSIPQHDLQLAEFMTSNTVSPQLQKLVDAIKLLEISAQQLQNNISIFDVNVDGTQYSVLKESVTATSGVHCPPGAVQRNMFCVYCTPGTFSENGKCQFCHLGTYQDESGRSECKICPSGKTTDFTGSTSEEDCTVYCRPGTFSQNGTCVLCDLGTYQDESGRSDCKNCPSGSTTNFTGSTDSQNCSVSVEVTSSTSTDDGLQNEDGGGGGGGVDNHRDDRGHTDKDTDVGTITGATIGAVTCLVILGLVIFAVYWKLCRSKLREYQLVFKTEGVSGSRESVSKV